MYRTDDPAADYDRWDREQQKKLEQLPICDICGYPIQQECAVLLGEHWYCDDCLREARTPIEVDW